MFLSFFLHFVHAIQFSKGRMDKLLSIYIPEKGIRQIIQHYFGTGAICKPLKETPPISDAEIWKTKLQCSKKANQWGMCIVKHLKPIQMHFFLNGDKNRFFSQFSQGMNQFPQWNDASFVFESGNALIWIKFNSQKCFSISLKSFVPPFQWVLLGCGILILEIGQKRGFFLSIDEKTHYLSVFGEPFLTGYDKMRVSPCQKAVFLHDCSIHYRD